MIEFLKFSILLVNCASFANKDIAFNNALCFSIVGIEISKLPIMSFVIDRKAVPLELPESIFCVLGWFRYQVKYSGRIFRGSRSFKTMNMEDATAGYFMG